MTSPLQVYSAYQQRLQAQDYEQLGEVVDLRGYTENCLGLTGWTTGFQVALRNYTKNIMAAFSDMQYTLADIIEGADALAIRSRVEGTHTGTFLNIPATGRRIAWDYVALVHITDGKVAGQWIQPDLWSIYQQLTSASPEPPTSVAAEPALDWAHSAH
jgi:predicted ester cyclase